MSDQATGSPTSRIANSLPIGTLAIPTKQTRNGIDGYDRGIIAILICAQSKTLGSQSDRGKFAQAKTALTD